ncbi:MAG: lasso peptide biosynthesis B2 protein [Vicinamibacterales bacterium]
MGQFSRWRARFATVVTFSPADWWAFGESFAVLFLLQALLGLFDFPRVLAWATRVSAAPNFGAWPADRVERLAWLVDLAGRLLRRRCLVRSLAVSRVFGRRGVVTDLRIGVQTAGGTLSAHAWVEWNGRALNDHPDHLERFAPFNRIGGDASHG